MKVVNLARKVGDLAMQQAEENLFYRGQLWLKVVYDIRENVRFTDFVGRISRQIRAELK